MRDGLSKLDQCLALGLSKIDYSDVANIIGASDPQFLADFCDAIIDRNLSKALKLLDDGINMGIDALRLYSDVADYFRDLLMIKTSKDYSLIVNTEEEVIKKYEEQTGKLSLQRILKIIETLFEGQNMAKYLTSPKLSFETVLLKIAEKNTDTDIEALLERINTLEEKLDKLSEGEVIIKTVIEDKEELTEQEIKEEITEPYDDSGEEYVFPSFEEEEEEFVFPNEIVSEEPVFESKEETEEEYVFPDKTSEEEFPFENPFDEDINVIPSSDLKDQQVIEPEKSFVMETTDKEESDEELENIALNFKEFSSQMKNKDIGFDLIIRAASMYIKDGALIIEFENKASFDIAKANKYDEMIINAAKDIHGIDIFVKLKYQNIVSEPQNENKDPLDDLFEIAEQNQIIFNFEE